MVENSFVCIEYCAAFAVAHFGLSFHTVQNFIDLEVHGGLFRVMPISRLLKIVDQKALTLVTYRKFVDDPNEGSLIQLLRTKRGMQAAKETLQSHGESIGQL